MLPMTFGEHQAKGDRCNVWTNPASNIKGITLNTAPSTALPSHRHSQGKAGPPPKWSIFCLQEAMLLERQEIRPGRIIMAPRNSPSLNVGHKAKGGTWP